MSTAALHDAIDQVADRIPNGHLLAETDPAALMEEVAQRLDVLNEVTAALEAHNAQISGGNPSALKTEAP